MGHLSTILHEVEWYVHRDALQRVRNASSLTAATIGTESVSRLSGAFTGNTTDTRRIIRLQKAGRAMKAMAYRDAPWKFEDVRTFNSCIRKDKTKNTVTDSNTSVCRCPVHREVVAKNPLPDGPGIVVLPVLLLGGSPSLVVPTGDPVSEERTW
ncbi:hypothetical protein EVG20_g5360 [Dentipellis fragilis]|uniref:Uncharacterized protein n=1 Tax=Dentipellis fragilis TaxID=205917 RepID=A0A4Y9YVW7_9AGAM|nr:hypothetical protein EVG20_g5360 [Dentipellis fragilis]